MKTKKLDDREYITYHIYTGNSQPLCKELNTQSFGRISVLSEIKISSAYLDRGCKIDIEPLNRKIGKSGLEGRSDLRVNLNGE